MKNKTLLEAATDMLLNRPQSTVSENISPRVLETLNLLSLHKILDKAIDAVGEKYIKEDDDSEITDSFRALQGDIDDLLNIVEDGKDNLDSFSGKILQVSPNIKENEALDLTGAVLEEISARCESILESMEMIDDIKKLADSILEESYTDFNSTVINFSESADKEELEEGNEELDQIKSVMADIANRLKKNPNKTIKTNFGNVVGMGKTDKGFDYIKFQSQYRGATKDPKIAANDRNSHGYVLKHLTITD